MQRQIALIGMNDFDASGLETGTHGGNSLFITRNGLRAVDHPIAPIQLQRGVAVGGQGGSAAPGSLTARC